MKVLFVVDEFPFPARNGVTIPVANFIKQFHSRGYLVDLLYFDTGDNYPIDAGLMPFINYFHRVPLTRKNKFRGLFNELRGHEAIFESWNLAGEKEPHQFLTSYDLIWASPIRPFALWLKFKNELRIDAKDTIASVNDSYELTLRALSKKKNNFLLRKLYGCRASAMSSIESGLLEKASFVAVQSQKEVDFFGGKNNKKLNVVELKNGVSENYFIGNLDKEYDLIFVGTLDDFYKNSLNWFINNVYSKLSQPRPSFIIIGKGATNKDIEFFKSLSIEYIPFVDELDSFYFKSKILVAPIFKGYGTINKVLEAMASACVVVGDETAFNGIEGFLDSTHGLVANSESQFIEKIKLVLENKELARTIGENSRNLMMKNFSWDSRVDKFLALNKAYEK